MFQYAQCGGEWATKRFLRLSHTHEYFGNNVIPVNQLTFRYLAVEWSSSSRHWRYLL